MGEFQQEGPRLENQYRGDDMLRRYLQRRLPPGELASLEPHLDHMGERAATDLWTLAQRAERNPPRHRAYDAWGRRIDAIETDPAWDEFKRISAREGLVAIGYERRQGVYSRLYQFALLYLFHPSSAVYSCPLAMTDGAARALELYADEALRERALSRLTSRDPDRFWTSGQWMTERSGGSDVSGTGTIAKPMADGEYRLFGRKFFTSATNSEMAMALARIEGDPDGSRGLSLFYLELRDPDGHYNHMTVDRLKEKLGTRALPTAELTLNGSRATLVGGPGHGVRKIASLFNITRIYNAVCATGYMRRGLALARDYASRRHAFGRPLIEHPLHLQTLADLEVGLRGSFALVFHVIELLGRDELGAGDAETAGLLRLLTPVAKLFTAKESIRVCSEVLECFGGAGYMEDTHLPELLRNTQVLSIWEGTTNVLSLDLLRALNEGTFAAFEQDVARRLDSIRLPALVEAQRPLRERLVALKTHYLSLSGEPRALAELGARAFAFAVAHLLAGSLLMEQAQWEASRCGDDRALAAALAWCRRPQTDLVPPRAEHLDEARCLGAGAGAVQPHAVARSEAPAAMSRG